MNTCTDASSSIIKRKENYLICVYSSWPIVREYVRYRRMKGRVRKEGKIENYGVLLLKTNNMYCITVLLGGDLTARPETQR